MIGRNVVNLFIKPFSKKFSIQTNILKSKLPDVVLPNIPVHEYIWKNLDKWPDKTALVCIDTNRSYTFYQIYKRSLVLTKFLRESFKLQPQDTVAIILPNLPEYPIALLGALQAGLRITTCNPNYTSHEIGTQLIDSDAKIVFTCSELVANVIKSLENIERNIKVVSVNQPSINIPNDIIDFNEITSGEPGTPVSINLDNVAFLPYSSGTTGLPKGVQLTQRNIVSNLSQMSVHEICLLQEATSQHQDVMPAFLPFYHIYGLSMLLLRGLALGVKTVTISKFSSEVFIKTLREHHPNIIFGVPSTVLMIINNPNITLQQLSSIRAILSGAAPLGASDVEQFKDKTQGKVNLLQGYGMTETSPLTLHQSPYIENGIKIGGTGILTPNTEARIIPVDSSPETSLGCNEQGEILFRGPQVMKGYLNNPKANEEVLLKDGWFKSGDVGYYDEDGQFYITDRLKEFIKVKGFQVAPAELEAILREHPKVEDVGIIGVPHKILGEAPKAYIVTKSGATIQELELEAFVAKKVSKHKHLTGGVSFIGAIPRNPSGKILRKELRKIHANQFII